MLTPVIVYIYFMYHLRAKVSWWWWWWWCSTFYNIGDSVHSTSVYPLQAQVLMIDPLNNQVVVFYFVFTSVCTVCCYHNKYGACHMKLQKRTLSI